MGIKPALSLAGINHLTHLISHGEASYQFLSLRKCVKMYMDQNLHLTCSKEALGPQILNMVALTSKLAMLYLFMVPLILGMPWEKSSQMTQIALQYSLKELLIVQICIQSQMMILLN